MSLRLHSLEPVDSAIHGHDAFLHSILVKDDAGDDPKKAADQEARYAKSDESYDFHIN